MNVDVIRAAVNVEPERLDMFDFVYLQEGCGTVGCLAGNCLLQSGRSFDSIKNDPGMVVSKAAELMGIRSSQAPRLFYTDEWPDWFVGDVNSDGEHCEKFVVDENGTPLTPRTPEYLARVKERVEHFIATGGAE